MKLYGSIYADPPWRFATYSDKGKGRSPEAHYDCMSLPEIKALPVLDHAAPDCTLYLWVTDPLLPEGIEVMRAWGFTYKTVAFTWAKTTQAGGWHVGMGYYTRANPEMCLLGTVGSPQRYARDVRQLVVSRRREHSRKPDSIRDDIRRLSGGPYLELFARESQPGWDVAFSNQSGLFDAGSVATRRWRSTLSRPGFS